MKPTTPCRVLVLRPMPGNAETVGRLAMQGVAALSIPLFAVAPTQAAGVPDGAFDAVLLTSANAVHFGGRTLARFQNLPAWCVGEATAAAARSAGMSVGRVGEQGVSALLSGTSERLLWLCGEQRTCLPTGAEARITALPVYRTVDLPFPPSALVRPCIAMLHSRRAAERFAGLATQRANIAIVAISAAVAVAAGEGWQSITVAARPEDGEMVSKAVGLCMSARHDG